jgi:hypothetical protein
MKQTIYYSDGRSSEFSVERWDVESDFTNPRITSSLSVFIRGGSGGINSLCFYKKEDVDEFCELLQQKKNEIWP